MTRKGIINELAKYLDETTISKLEMVANDKDLVLVMTVGDICKEYNSTVLNEIIVSDLLVQLVSNCF